MTYGKFSVHSESLVTSKMAHIFLVTLGKGPSIKSEVSSLYPLNLCYSCNLCWPTEFWEVVVCQFKTRLQEMLSVSALSQRLVDTRWMNKPVLEGCRMRDHIQQRWTIPLEAILDEPISSWLSSWLIHKLFDKTNWCIRLLCSTDFTHPSEEMGFTHCINSMFLKNAMLIVHHPHSHQLLILKRAIPLTFLFAKVHAFLSAEQSSPCQPLPPNSNKDFTLHIWKVISAPHASSLTISSFKGKREAYTMHSITDGIYDTEGTTECFTLKHYSQLHFYYTC